LLRILEQQAKIVKLQKDKHFHLYGKSSIHLGELINKGFLSSEPVYFKRLRETKLKIPLLRNRRDDIQDLTNLNPYPYNHLNTTVDPNTQKLPTKCLKE